MKKSELLQHAEISGAAQCDLSLANGSLTITPETDLKALRLWARQQAEACWHVIGRTEAAREKFVSGYVQAAAKVYNALPEVVRKHKIEALQWELDRALEYQSDIVNFAERLANDPLYAFSYGESALQAAAKVTVAKTLKEVLAAHGYEAAMEYAMEQTLNGARYPSHSTSALSNLAKEYETAAYASFIRR